MIQSYLRANLYDLDEFCILQLMKKRIKKQPSLAVIRAVARLKEYECKKESQSIVWDGKSITQYSSITS